MSYAIYPSSSHGSHHYGHLSQPIHTAPSAGSYIVASTPSRHRRSSLSDGGYGGYGYNYPQYSSSHRRHHSADYRHGGYGGSHYYPSSYSRSTGRRSSSHHHHSRHPQQVIVTSDTGRHHGGSSSAYYDANPHYRERRSSFGDMLRRLFGMGSSSSYYHRSRPEYRDGLTGAHVDHRGRQIYRV